MKLQYLGDSKDSFKWDYHNHLVSSLAYPTFNIALMMTPDDDSGEGKSKPELFNARHSILEFCQELREVRDAEGIKAIERIKNLPKKAGASYGVTLHNGVTDFTKAVRQDYFSGFKPEMNQVVFLDPDNGFQPERAFTKKHVGYSDVTQILTQISGESVVSIFQHFRRKSFPDDFARIRQRIETGYSTAIYWHSLMFVAIGKSKQAIQRVAEINRLYEESKKSVRALPSGIY
jgi:hypothetical protein